MALWRKTKETIKYSEHDQFMISCDCTSEAQGCIMLHFGVWDDSEGLESFLNITPGPYPLRFWDRLKYAWATLAHGELRWQEILLDKPTIDRLVLELSALSSKMSVRNDEYVGAKGPE
jgi:hypothetical protein